MIEVERLTKKYGDRTVLSDISLSFSKGQVVSLVGPSGGGKSTLLRCLNGLESFDGGAITIVGEKLVPGGDRLNKAALAAVRRRVGMVFQQWNLFAHRTAVGNIIEAPVHVRGMSVAEATERAHQLLSRVGLSHRATAYPHEMSGGEQQRVAIARAVAKRPDLLLCDEPTGALDITTGKVVLGVLERVNRELGATTALITHNASIARMADRVISMADGRIAELRVNASRASAEELSW